MPGVEFCRLMKPVEVDGLYTPRSKVPAAAWSGIWNVWLPTVG